MAHSSSRVWPRLGPLVWFLACWLSQMWTYRGVALQHGLKQAKSGFKNVDFDFFERCFECYVKNAST